MDSSDCWHVIGTHALRTTGALLFSLIMLAPLAVANQWVEDEDEWGPNPLPDEGEAYLYAYVKALYQDTYPCRYLLWQHNHDGSYVTHESYSIVEDEEHAAYYAWTRTELWFGEYLIATALAELPVLPWPSPPFCPN